MPSLFLPLLLHTLLAAAPITAGEVPALRATELHVCRDVVDRACRGGGTAFPADVTNVYFLTRIEGATGEAFVFHVYTCQGKEVRRIRLPVMGPSFRAWSTKTVRGLPGKWRAEVFDPVGRSLGAVEFTVEAPKRPHED